MIFYL